MKTEFTFDYLKLDALDIVMYLYENPDTSKEWINKYIETFKTLFDNCDDKEKIFEEVNEDNYYKYGFLKSGKENFYYVPTHLLSLIPNGIEVYNRVIDEIFIKDDSHKLMTTHPTNIKYAIRLLKGDK